MQSDATDLRYLSAHDPRNRVGHPVDHHLYRPHRRRGVPRAVSREETMTAEDGKIDYHLIYRDEAGA